ncbi:hypothetical protein GIX45_26370 [Erwinia sp. CPCC 100877]|nr:hypothetical protein [Erwinia sp. CPCC 100877]
MDKKEVRVAAIALLTVIFQFFIEYLLRNSISGIWLVALISIILMIIYFRKK